VVCLSVIVCGLFERDSIWSVWVFEWERVCAGFLLLAYTCISAGDSFIKRGYWYPINRFNPPQLCTCPKPGPGFQTSYVILVFCVRDDCFVNIGRIVDHHCLNFPFINVFRLAKSCISQSLHRRNWMFDELLSYFRKQVRH
jgi:hypothetical protein